MTTDEELMKLRFENEQLRQQAVNAEHVAHNYRAKLYALARVMPEFLEDFISTYSPFALEALDQHYRELLKTAREFVQIFEEMVPPE